MLYLIATSLSQLLIALMFFKSKVSNGLVASLSVIRKLVLLSLASLE